MMSCDRELYDSMTARLETAYLHVAALEERVASLAALESRVGDLEREVERMKNPDSIFYHQEVP